MKNSRSSRLCSRKIASWGRAAVFLTAAAVLPATTAPNTADAAPSRSTNIAPTFGEMRVVVVNREANSISIIQVKNKNGNDVSNKIAEIPVGEELRCVAVHPSDRAAYLNNAISGSTVSVVNLNLRGPSARLLAKEELAFKAKSNASQSLNSGVGHLPVIETQPIISDGTAEMAQSSSGVGAFATTGDLP